MKKILLILVAVIIFGIIAQAQDVIVTTDGKKINSKVIEVNENDIRYKLFDNPSGPTYFLKKSEIASILYENGHVDVFKISPLPTYYYPHQYPKQDLKNAKDLRNSGVILFSAGMAFTFPIGLSLLFTPSRYYDPYSGSYYYNYSQMIAGFCFIGIGPALTVSGIVMWAVGQTRMDRIKRFNPNGFSLFENEKVQFNLAVGGNSMGLKLNF
ncbi:MAG: hypothetical protein LBI45_07945 [Bacteroidales bacterium]|jgi:hypothetical protein|nr:hypothetical protein [Bacteroidales bacterium]